MKIVENINFKDERSLFKIKDALISNCTFIEGESPLKESENLTVENCTFSYKYPLWYGKNHRVRNCLFEEMSRSGVWYTVDSAFEDCKIIAPKLFRRCANLLLKDLTLNNANETLWYSKGCTLENIQANNGDYFGLGCENVTVKNMMIQGNYIFDSAKNITVIDSHLMSKDAFWNCENITVRNSVIDGEYLAWNSENVLIENTKIISHQGMCYVKKLKLVNCQILQSDLIFEYCEDLNCQVTTVIDSVKNPISGRILAKGIKELILDDEKVKTAELEIKYE